MNTTKEQSITEIEQIYNQAFNDGFVDGFIRDGDWNRYTQPFLKSFYLDGYNAGAKVKQLYEQQEAQNGR